MNDKLRVLMQEARKSCNMKQKDVAKKLGLRGSTISNWENGVSDPDIDAFVCLCGIYGLDFSSVLVSAYGDPTQNAPILDYDQREHELIKKFRALDERGKRNVENTLEHEYREARPNLEESSGQTTSVC